MKIAPFIEVTELTPEEETEYKSLDPGITQTKDMIRMVAMDGDVKQTVEITSGGISRIRVKMQEELREAGAEALARITAEAPTWTDKIGSEKP